MKIEIQEGDVVFKRVHNGWIIHGVVENEEEYLETYVVEDTTDDPSEALGRALWEAFNPYFRSKHYGGIEVNHKKSGIVKKDYVKQRNTKKDL
jgi:hypothetical protein